MSLEQVAGGFGDGVEKVVLVVSSDPGLTAEVLAAVEPAGHRTHHVTSVAAALVLATSQVVNLAVIDAQLPDGDGVILGQQLVETHRLPFIQFACGEDAEISCRAIAAGALNVLLKPTGVTQLGLAIDVALVRAREAHRQERAVERLSLDFDRKKAVSIAIGMTMERHHVEETEAYEMLLFAARARQLKLAEFCRQFVDNHTAVGLLRGLGTVVPTQQG